MKKLISLSLLLSFALLSTAHASSSDLGASDLAGSTVDTSVLTALSDFTSRNAEITALAANSSQYAENVALVNQINSSGVEAYAYINQSGGTGNFAAIMQDARVNAASAVIFQVGSGNRAIINQH